MKAAGDFVRLVGECRPRKMSVDTRWFALGLGDFCTNMQRRTGCICAANNVQSRKVSCTRGSIELRG